MKNKVISAVFAMGVLGATISSASAQNCSDIEDSSDRLACFDQKFPAPKPVTKPEKLSTTAIPSPPPTQSDPTPVATQPPQKIKKGGIFDFDEAVDFEAEVTSVRVRDKQRPVYAFSNGQVWMQDSSRPAGLNKGDTVRIKNATFQGYMLITKHGRSIRVKRIK